ncbi:nuclear transport factor 2 family protein [Nonomuraea rhodomycinica]|uniref:Nuclear transport factor 2 family protein n=1 Tax=Nonomuraea rhodomycinica TaxID=1712872 RepID=A0A7Y6ISX6_9ACTN|nr:nuclear transport factor 2 family protein [Nonomuraea rhodomycinica]NUW43829.1 nuclear transport factor 2 family protein [Nonomuraea rhodomycinica]
MSDINELVQRYLAAWNETDATARRAALAEVFAEDATYTDPLVSVRGLDGLDATIAAVQGQFGGLVFSLGGAVDAHHDIARFTWNLGPEGGEALAVGFDVAVVGEDGRISQVLGFLDKVPAGA